MKQLHSLLSMLVLLGLMILPTNGWADEFVVYSTRSEQLLGPLLEAYTNETDIKIDLITDKFETLLHRLKTEGKDTRADLLITVDAGDLWHATRAGVLQSINSTTLKENIGELQVSSKLCAIQNYLRFGSMYSYMCSGKESSICISVLIAPAPRELWHRGMLLFF
jgi:ABC-type thiamine transport system substrate-binding protein